MRIRCTELAVDDEKRFRPTGPTAFETRESPRIDGCHRESFTHVRGNVVHTVLDDRRPGLATVVRLSSSPRRGHLSSFGNVQSTIASSFVTVQPTVGSFIPPRDTPTERPMEEQGFRERLLERVCERRPAVTIVFVLSGALFVVSLLIFVFADISEASNVIALIDAVISGVVLVGTGSVLRVCNRFQDEP